MQLPAGGEDPRARPLQRSSETAIRHLGDRDLEELRQALSRALRELRVGSPAGQVVGRLSGLTRAELRRRERGTSGPPHAAWTRPTARNRKAIRRKDGRPFTDTSEYLEELAAERDNVKRGIVRLTKRATPAEGSAGAVTHVAVESPRASTAAS